MFQEILEIRSITNSKLSLQRSIMRLLESSEFERAYEKASESDKQNLIVIVHNSSKEALQTWIKQLIDKRSIQQLYVEAQQLGIRGFKQLTKGQLVFKIQERRYASSKEEYSR